VIERDVLAAIAQRGMSPAASAASAATEEAPAAIPAAPSQAAPAPAQAAASRPAPTTSGDGYRDEKLSNLRGIIARTMQQSLQNGAQLTLNASFDATDILALRARIKAHPEAGLADITLNDMVLFAVARTLPRHPYLNAHFLDNKIRAAGLGLLILDREEITTNAGQVGIRAEAFVEMIETGGVE
jgi:pyruvate dehydrogenase E2 component (dihydrolipoamide acetyltransferase)